MTHKNYLHTSKWSWGSMPTLFFFLVNMVYLYTQIEWYNLTVSLRRWKFFSYCVFVLTSCKYQVLLFGQILCSHDCTHC